MSNCTEKEDEFPEIRIRRPLNIGYEMLPEGLSALDFIQYEVTHIPKPNLYRKDELPLHELFGDKAVICPELLEEEPIEHSELWLKIVSKLYPELLPVEQEKPEEQEFLPSYLIDQPIHQGLVLPLAPKKFIEKENVLIAKKEIIDSKGTEEIIKKPPIYDVEALAKLKETVNWLKYCENKETEESKDKEDNQDK